MLLQGSMYTPSPHSISTLSFTLSCSLRQGLRDPLPSPASLRYLPPQRTLEVSQPCLHLSRPSTWAWKPSLSSHLLQIWPSSVLSHLSSLPGSPPCAPPPRTSPHTKLQTMRKYPHLFPRCPEFPIPPVLSIGSGRSRYEIIFECHQEGKGPLSLLVLLQRSQF